MAVSDNREQIRQAYKIHEADAPTKMIPAMKKMDINDDARSMRVCAYCRVSTGNDEQLSSFVLQQEHYSLSFYAKNERCGLFCAAGDYPECNS